MLDFIETLPSMNEIFSFILEYWYAFGGTASMIAIVIYVFKLITLKSVNKQNKNIFDKVLDKVIVQLWNNFETLLNRKVDSLEENNNLNVKMLKNELKDLKSKSEAFTNTILEQNNELKSKYEQSLLQLKSYEEKAKVMLSQEKSNIEDNIEDKKDKTIELIDENKQKIDKQADKINKDIDKKIKKTSKKFESELNKNGISLD